MAKVVLRNCHIEVNSVDLSDHVDNVVINLNKPSVVATAFGDAGRQSMHGITTDSFTINFHQNFDAAEVDATLSPLYFDETTFPVSVRPFSGTVSATNPEYTGQSKLFEYQPLSGGVGELSTTSVEFEVQGEIARGTGGV